MKEYAECDSHTGTWGRGSSGCGHPVLSIAFSNSLFNVHHSSDPVSYISVALTICALIPCGHAARLSNGVHEDPRIGTQSRAVLHDRFIGGWACSLAYLESLLPGVHEFGPRYVIVLVDTLFG